MGFDKKENCLLILPRPIFPLVCGYALKNYNLIRILSEQYSLFLVVISPSGITDEEEKYYRSLGVKCMVYSIPKWKSYLRVLQGIFTSKPLQVCYYYDPELKKKISRLADSSDVLISALVRTREYITDWESKKIVVFDMVDSIAMNYKRSRSNTKSFFWKCIYGFEGKRLMAYERKYVSHSNITYLFNKDEQEYWKQYGNVKCLPHGVNEALFTYEKQDPSLKGSVVFMGKMDYQPNVDAVLWYLQNVQSLIDSEIPFVIVGAFPSEKIIKMASLFKNVKITGIVEDPYIYANSAMALIAPMQTGGGIQNKVLEGMALGRVNVVSTLAAEPITGARDHVHLLIADTAADYLKILQDIWKSQEQNNSTVYRNIGIEARKLIQDNFTWKKYGEAYLQGINAEHSVS